MTHVVTEACIKCKYTDCVEVCPVECFHEGDFMVVIDPDQCIDCGICVSVCPIEAIKPESPDLAELIEYASAKSAIWPTISTTKGPLPNAEHHKNEQQKFSKYCQ